MSEKIPKRPDGLTAIAILWFIAGLVNVYSAFQTISYLSAPRLVPALLDLYLKAQFIYGVQFWISVTILLLGIAQIITVLGLWAGKRYSYNLAYVLSAAFPIVNLSLAGLYASAPVWLDLRSNVTTPLIFAIVGMAWLVIYWWYLGKPHVKAYLGVT